jgi:hypothetical protein
MKLNILRFLVIILACASALVVIINRVGAQNSAATANEFVSLSKLGIPLPAQTPAAVATAPQEKTVDQTRKNIQVLKGLPESQLGTVMNFVATSLGRRCDYCHVNKGGTWIWESDDKEEKLTARKMMQMVLAINKDNFRGNPQVSCYTCHRGRSQPSLMPLPVPTPAPRPSPPPAASPQASPSPRPAGPTADQILDKYVAAVGGQASIDKMKSLVMRGTYTGVNGTEIPYQVELVAPDKFHINAGEGTVERGFDGKSGWQKNAQGVTELTNPVLDDLRSMFGFYRNLKLKEQFTQMRVARERIGDRDAIVLAARAADNHRERLSFDAETGLLLRRIIYMDSPVGVIPYQVDYEDYRDVDGVKLPFLVRVASVEPGFISTRKYAEIKLNAPVDDSKFKAPAPPKPATP